MAAVLKVFAQINYAYNLFDIHKTNSRHLAAFSYAVLSTLIAIR